ncbi:MAG: autorepressor SdpR family transcription factor [Lachnospiraceae bacterium]|nr:autorepressor SdpR family transcription factor [Lachnospiraceae bacterium]
MALADTFKALSDPARREILELLKNGPLSAGEIAQNFDMTQATVSYHLKVLRKADLIREKRDRNFIFYELNMTIVEELMAWLSELKGGKTT